MDDKDKTKGELIIELRELRTQIKNVEASKIKLRRAKAEIQQARSYAENIVETVREPLLVLDGDLKIVSANRSFYQTFKVTPSNTLGRLVYDLGNRQWDIPRLRILLEEILPKQTHFGRFEVEHDFPTVGHKIMRLNARQIHQEVTGKKMILLAAEDITRFKEARKENERISFPCSPMT